jgi:hypothetical protein
LTPEQENELLNIVNARQEQRAAEAAASDDTDDE